MSPAAEWDSLADLLKSYRNPKKIGHVRPVIFGSFYWGIGRIFHPFRGAERDAWNSKRSTHRGLKLLSRQAPLAVRPMGGSELNGRAPVIARSGRRCGLRLSGDMFHRRSTGIGMISSPGPMCRMFSCTPEYCVPTPPIDARPLCWRGNRDRGNSGSLAFGLSRSASRICRCFRSPPCARRQPITLTCRRQ